MDMNYIPTNLKINIEWTVMKGVGNEAEDFSRSAVALFLFSEQNRWTVPCVADYTGVVKAQLPETLAEGVYSLDLIWVKNDGSVKGSRCIQRTRKPCVFAVDAGTQPPAGYDGQPVTLKIRTVAAPYGYDGLSAYEIAVLRGATTLDEHEWSKGLFNDVLANELKRNQEEIKETQETVQGLIDTLENLAGSGGSGGGVAAAKNVIYNPGNSSLNSSNAQDAIDELSAIVDESVAMATPLTGEDGSCILEIERNNGTYIEFPIPKAGEDNDGIMSKEDKAKLDSIIPSGLIVSNNGGAALNICDTKGNIIVRFSGGHIRTKFFDSRNYSTDTTPDDMDIKGTTIIVKDADFSEVAIGDGSGNMPPHVPVPPEVLEQFAYNFPFTVGG